MSSSDYEVAFSIVIICHNMVRELPRTIQTLSAPYQNGIADLKYEIIVVDNGSSIQVDIDKLFQITPLISIFSYVEASKSPVAALNFGLSVARGKYICAWIDGARMASPGLLANAVKMVSLSPRMVVGALSLHLGREPQNWSVKWGYDQEIEDKLLKSIDWLSNGYGLFDISSFDPSSRFGYFSCPAETNCLFMSRDMWDEYKFYDPVFRSAGGGLVNLDLWYRLCDGSVNNIVILAGEATFHQVHGGTTTNAVEDQWDLMNSEYATIRGHKFVQPTAKIIIYGNFNYLCLEFLKRNGFSLHAHKYSGPRLEHYFRRLLTKRGRIRIYHALRRRMERILQR